MIYDQTRYLRVVAVNRRFLFRGRVYLKIAQSMTEDIERNGNIFTAETEIEAEEAREPDLPNQVEKVV